MSISFSVLLSLYSKENPVYLRRSLDSVFGQTLPPNEVVLVEDGPLIPALYAVVEEYARKYPALKVIPLPENVGLGRALNEGLKHCSYELVARMDTDDIAMPDRFEKQIAYMTAHPECDLLGGQISEFIDEESNVVGFRKVPCLHTKILVRLKGRCPFNHMSVMMLRSRVLACGNYMDWHFNEDYYMWIRMALGGCRFANLPDTLVNVRVGKEMYRRRGGWKYFKSTSALQKYMLANKVISPFRYLFNVSARFVVQVLMPNSAKQFVYRHFLRK